VKAIWLEDGRLDVRDVPVPEPSAGEARVRVHRAGICNTDLELVRGYYPFTGVLGHEFVGVVEAGPSEFMGRRVVGEINAVCGKCPACRGDRRNHCENRTVLGIVGRDGAFAEYLTLPIDNLHLVPEHVSDDQATFTEPLAAALEIQQQIDVSATDRVLVVGDGKLGQLIARTLALTGCDLTVLGRHAEKLDLLKPHGNAIDDPNSVEPAAFDITVECTGNADGFATARRALRPRGTLVLKSTYAGDLTFDASALVVDEIMLVGSRCGPFAPALELLANGTIDVTPLVHARYELKEGIDAFEHAVRPGVLKVLLEVE
jgi:threonine dehydrogenase-like Zn-dependent dehydrogenase